MLYEKTKKGSTQNISVPSLNLLVLPQIILNSRSFENSKGGYDYITTHFNIDKNKQIHTLTRSCLSIEVFIWLISTVKYC